VRGAFITATDTGVGKTMLSACLLAAMRADGEQVRAFKPAVTGLDEPADGPWPADHELLGLAAGMPPQEVAPLRFGAAASPRFAAQLAGDPIDREQLLALARAAQHPDAALIVEGVGGLLVPLADSLSICDLAAALALPVLIAARPGLGTINHSLLTLRVARSARLDVRAVVLSPWPRQPTPLERSNLETIAELGDIEVATLEQVPECELAALARAGGRLPWRRWLR